MNSYHGHKHGDGELSEASEYIIPKLERILENTEVAENDRIFDLGCGNGAVAAHLQEAGYSVTGVDPSIEGVMEAKNKYPDVDINMGSAYDNLGEEYGQFRVVISLEVVEHVHRPWRYANALHELTDDGGYVMISTPYHGYVKNLLIAMKGAWGRNHYNPLRPGGHIKIWSPDTLSTLLQEVGFDEPSFHRVGRWPFSSIAKSMIAVASKPK